MSGISIDRQGPLRLIGKVQNYFWGKVGESSRIHQFEGARDKGKPLAEYWLGAHPKGAATVLQPSGEQASLGAFLGEGVVLPFMMKVLSINSEFGLSIQTHPDEDLAKVLHARDPQNYPDPFHKPEIGVALTPVSLLYGFKPPEKLRSTLALIPELSSCLNSKTVERVMGNVGAGGDAERLQDMFTELFTADANQIALAVKGVLNRSNELQTEFPEISVLERLAPCYGAQDTGLLAILVMNLVTVSPGEGIFIGPNIPHAYLAGDLVECMACSDNVIRAGLTKKFQDRSTLISCLDYARAGVPVLLQPVRADSGVEFFDLPVTEFSLGIVRMGRATLDIGRKVGILLCLGGEAVVKNAGSGASLHLGDGEAALLQAGSGRYECEVISGEMFVASGETVSK